MKGKERMCVSEFKKLIDIYAEEIACDGKGINSHNIRSSVTAYCEETDQYFDIIDIDVNRLLGCGCWFGITIELREDK